MSSPLYPGRSRPAHGPGRINLVTAPALGLTLASKQIVVRRRLAKVPMAFIPVNGVSSMLYMLGVELNTWIGGGGLA